jgi:hypothetical protein
VDRIAALRVARCGACRSATTASSRPSWAQHEGSSRRTVSRVREHSRVVLPGLADLRALRSCRHRELRTRTRR